MRPLAAWTSFVLAFASLSYAVRFTEGKPPKEAAKPAKSATQSNAGAEAEKEFWEEVKNSTDADEIELYLEQFPDGTFAGEAQSKLAALRAKK